MKPAYLKVRYAVLGLCLLVAVAGALCWYRLDLAGHFLVKSGLDRAARNERPGTDAPQTLNHFRWRVAEATTWGALQASPGLGLEPELVVESYKCSKSDGRALDFAEISGRSIGSGEVITVVLRRGACPR